MEETPTQEVVEEVSTNPEPEVEEQQAADAPTQDVPVEEPQEETQEEPAAEAPEEQPSRRESLRIQQLLEKYGEPDGKSAAPVLPDALDYNTALDADPDAIKKFEDDRRKYGEELYNKGLQQAQSLQFHTRLEIDAPRVEARYPQLDKDSDQFDAHSADDLNSMYLTIVGYNPKDGTVKNPNLRYADFVDAQMALSKSLATRKITESSKNIAKQAATTGLRPDGSTAKRLDLNKAPEQMTDEELDAVLGILPK